MSGKGRLRLTGRFGSAPLEIGHRTSAVLDLFGDHAEEIEAYGDQLLDIEVRSHTEKRSIKANNLCWELCSQIGRALRPPLPKEEVYRDAIRAVGEYEVYHIREEAVPDFLETRKLLGVGWFAEVTGDAPLRGWVEVLAYKGSSAYDSRAMSLLIDYLVDEAQQMELPIGYDLEQIAQIKEDWGKAVAGEAAHA